MPPTRQQLTVQKYSKGLPIVPVLAHTCPNMETSGVIMFYSRAQGGGLSASLGGKAPVERKAVTRVVHALMHNWERLLLLGIIITLLVLLCVRVRPPLTATKCQSFIFISSTLFPLHLPLQCLCVLSSSTHSWVHILEFDPAFVRLNVVRASVPLASIACWACTHQAASPVSQICNLGTCKPLVVHAAGSEHLQGHPGLFPAAEQLGGVGHISGALLR